MPKLAIGAVGDKYEQEADAVAAQVVQQLNHPQPAPVQRDAPEEEEDNLLQQKPLRPQVQRTEGYEDEEEDEIRMKPLGKMVQRTEGYDDEEEDEIRMKPLGNVMQLRGDYGSEAASPDLERSIQRERGKGQPMAEGVRQPMESAFGVDFGGVRIHTDNTADQLNQSIQAKAFTTGQDVFFRQGAYAPESRGGQALLAHELTHVVQQSGGLVQRSSLPSEPVIRLQSPEAASGLVIQRNPITDRLTEIILNDQETEQVRLLADHILKIIQFINAQNWEQAHACLWDRKVAKQCGFRISSKNCFIDPTNKDQSTIDIEIEEAIKKGMSFDKEIVLPEVSISPPNTFAGRTAFNDAELAMRVLPVCLEEWIHRLQNKIGQVLSQGTEAFKIHAETVEMEGYETWSWNEIDIYAIYKDLGWNSVLKAFKSRYVERKKYDDFTKLVMATMSARPRKNKNDNSNNENI
ncbi:MAG: DUF4157 domain-containing protein [Cyanobacteria bacterium P01_G01_bin.54]